MTTQFKKKRKSSPSYRAEKYCKVYSPYKHAYGNPRLDECDYISRIRAGGIVGATKMVVEGAFS